MAGAQSSLYVLNTALGHHPPLPPLTDDDINANIAAMCASFYAEISSDDDTEAIIADALNYANTSSDDDADARTTHARPPTALRTRTTSPLHPPRPLMCRTPPTTTSPIISRMFSLTHLLPRLVRPHPYPRPLCPPYLLS
jgi:hypothetical protein